jgi:lysophospholipase L1-like esterase
MSKWSSVNREYGDNDAESVDDLITSKSSSSKLEIDDDFPSYYPQSKPPKTCLFYGATILSYIIIYRAEICLGAALALCVGIAIKDFPNTLPHRGKRTNSWKTAFQNAHIQHDYSEIKSKYDLTLGSIDHWCLIGDDNECQCEDPLVPVSKHSSKKWAKQHMENMKVATETVMKLTDVSSSKAWNDFEGYKPGMDDGWIDGADDDWIYAKGARFGDDYSYFQDDALLGNDFGLTNNQEDNHDGVDVVGGNKDGGARRRKLESSGLDVVFIGDSITEQRQGTEHGEEVPGFVSIKEVFDKTFTKDKGGEFDGIAMGIAGDTAPNLLWRLLNGENPFGLDPKVYWIHVGINDLSIKGCSEEVVLLGILRVVEELQNTRPNAKIVINSILPVMRNQDGLLEHIGKHNKDLALKKNELNMADSSMSPKRMHVDLWPSIVSINQELSKFASKHQGVKFFDADEVFVEEREDSKYLKVDLMLDPVHPNLSGHKKWNNAIKKKLHEILKDA